MWTRTVKQSSFSIRIKDRTMMKSLEQIESLYKQDKERYKDRENEEVEEPSPFKIGVETATEEPLQEVAVETPAM